MDSLVHLGSQQPPHNHHHLQHQQNHQQQQLPDKFDNGVMDLFLNYPDFPVLGSTTLEQILTQPPSNLDLVHNSFGSPNHLDHHHQATSMSPDSSQWTTSGVESGSESLDQDLDCLPDSTTGGGGGRLDREDALSVNSDPMNSSSSEYSFAASPPSFELLIPEDFPLEDEAVRRGQHGGLKRKDCGEEEDGGLQSKKRARKSKVGPTELQCVLCEYTTRVKEHLASHMNSHASERKYMCNQCGQTFKWSHSLRRHQRTHTKDYNYKCTYCPKSFSRKDHLAVHEKLHDADNAETFPCPQCGVTFKNKKNLTGHLKTHTADKPYKCTACESEFTRRASLTRHVLAAHDGQGRKLMSWSV